MTPTQDSARSIRPARDRTALPQPTPLRPTDTSDDTENEVFDLIDHLMTACLRAIPGIMAITVAIEGSARAIGARSTSTTGTPIGLLDLQTAIGSLSNVCDRDQYAYVDFDLHAQQWPLLAQQARALGFASVHIVPLQAWGATVGTVCLFAQGTFLLSATQLRLASDICTRATRGFLGLGQRSSD